MKFLISLKLDQLANTTNDYVISYVCSTVTSQIKKMRPDSDETMMMKEQEKAMQSFVLEEAQDQCEYVMTALLYTFSPLSPV